MDHSTPDKPTIAAALTEVRRQVAEATRASGRVPEAVTLVAVSKTFPAEAIRAAAVCGQRHFGENYVQEALPKIARVRALLAAGVASPEEPLSLPLVWHFIGPIQSNKTQEIAEHFDWVHGVDREKIARRLSQQRPASLPPLNVCLQVNISGEASKSGVPPGELPLLAAQVAALPGLKLRGLMAIPEAGGDSRASFRRMRELLEDLNARGYGLDTLSMGMSGDFEAAIAEGATIIRVGSAIFGNRSYVK